MRLLSDTPFAVSFNPWSALRNRHALSVVVKATLQYAPDGNIELAEEHAPCTGEVFHEGPNSSLKYDNDLVATKPRGEFLIVGNCHTPAGVPVPVSAISAQVGDLTKTIAVFGDRYWDKNSMSEPEPFSEMPLRYERAFGGPGFEKNPVGRGIASIQSGKTQRIPLPNLEDPKNLIHRVGDRPDPMGAFPISPGWQQRRAKMGTFDKKWRAERWPDPPDDMSLGFYNSAPDDMQLQGFWRGDETIILRNLHRATAQLHTRLPGIRTRAFAWVQDGSVKQFREIGMFLDTITIDCEEQTIFCNWRGLLEVRSPAMKEVLCLFVLHESLQEQQSYEYYQSWYSRVAEKEGFSLEMAALSPQPPAEDKLPETETKPLDNALSAAGLAAGATPDTTQAANDSEPVETASETTPPPPNDDGPSGGSLELRQDVELAMEDKRSLAGMDLSGADLSELDLSEQDLTGAILSGANLAGAKCRGTNFEQANLAQADLRGADCTSAKFKGSDLTRARFKQATCIEAVFEDAEMTEIDFRECDLTRAVLTKVQMMRGRLNAAILIQAQANEADWSHAELDGAVLSEGSFKDIRWMGAKGRGVVAEKADLTGARAVDGAAFPASRFYKCKAEGSLWEEADLSETDFSGTQLERADFGKAILEKAKFEVCVMRKARFQGAKLRDAVMIKADAMECSFEGADLTNADFRGANLHGAQLFKATLDGAQWELALLTETLLAPTDTKTS